MHFNVSEYLKTCDRCRSAKQNCHPKNPPMATMPLVGRFHRWHIDIIGPLYKTKEGYEYILVVVDSFTRWTESFSLRTQTAKEVARILCSEVFSRFGAPKVLLSDRGQVFSQNLSKLYVNFFK